MTEYDIQAELGCHYGVEKGQIVVPKLRNTKPLTVYQKLKFARLGCLRWPSIWHHRNG